MKKTEIERLKSELEQIRHSILFETWGHSKALISELADALETFGPVMRQSPLVRRAREATK